MISNVRRPFLLACAALLTVIAVFGLLGSPAPVDAQATEAARLTVEASDIEDGTVTVTVALDPGTSQIAALTAGLTFDEASVVAASCEVSFYGVCGVDEGHVKFAGFSVSGFDEADDFVTVTFTTAGDAADPGAIPLDLDVVVASDEAGMVLDDVELVGAELHMVETLGSMTGDVIEAGSGSTLYGIDVCAAADTQAPTCVRTSSLGAFVIEGLASGTYTLVMSDPAGIYAPATQIVDVQSPVMTTGITAAMTRAGVVEEVIPVTDAPATPPAATAGDPSTISGTMTDASTGDAIFGVQVCATMPLIGTQACSYTTSTGEYRIEGLDTGNYNITASDPGQRYAATDGDRFVGVTSTAGAGSVDLSLDRN